jgi:Tol biopolymer transport system component
VSVSADGRFVAFVSAARLVPEDTNDRDDVYVLDRESGGVSFESAGTAVLTGHRPVISGTGRFLVYETGSHVLMIRDRATGADRPLQRDGDPPNGPSRGASISGDGRYVAFASAATNLVDDPDGGTAERVYVADTASMTFRRIAVSSFAPAISEDGRFVAFSSNVRPARNVNVYLDDLKTGARTTVSVSATGGPADGSSFSPSISSDGRYVAFVSEATNLVRHDRNKVADVYVRDTVAGITELISRTPSGDAGNAPSRHPGLSGDGRIVIFQSEASDLTCGSRCRPPDRDINLVADIFRRDRSAGVTELISRGRTPWMEPSMGPAADRTGGIVAFSSRHPLDQADDRHDYDLFVWARELRR